MNPKRDRKGRVLRQGERQRSDGRYEYRYCCADGKTRSIYSWKLVGTDRPPAGKPDCRPLRDMEREINGTSQPQSGIVTVEDMFTLLMQRKRKIKQSTRLEYGSRYRRCIGRAFGKTDIRNISSDDLFEHYSEMLENGGLSENSVHLAHTLNTQIFDLAVKNGILQKNPEKSAWKQIHEEYDFSSMRKHRSALTEEQQRLFLRFVSNSRHAQYMPIFTFLLGTGCRIGEAAALTWSDCDFENGMIRISKTFYYSGDGDGGVYSGITQPKTKNAVRSIPMLPDVRKALEAERKRQEETGVSNRMTLDGYSGFVFCSNIGTMIGSANISYHLHSIIRDYNKAEETAARKEKRAPSLLPDISPHIFRHTFCTRFCENESNLKIIQSIMGHANIATTMDVYNEATEKKKKEAFERLSEKIVIA